jgi:RNA polymerase sigma factor (sigma-70 family)
VLINADASTVAALHSIVMSERGERDPTEKSLGGDVIAELVRSHRDLLSFVERRVGSRAEAEDILQEAFVRGVQHEDALRAADSSSAWFYRTLRNAIVDRFRRRGAESRAYEAFAHELEETTPPLETRDVVCACVRTLAQTLQPHYADALQRVEIDGLTLQAFAGEAGISANNAAVRLHRAREALRRRVRVSCGTCAEHGCLDCTCGA